jgi:hypothetical protein
MWILVLISLQLGAEPEIRFEGPFNGMIACFEARDEYFPEVYPPLGKQGVCVKVLED